MSVLSCGASWARLEQVLANQTAATRIWRINRKTGGVSGALNGAKFRHRLRAHRHVGCS